MSVATMMATLKLNISDFASKLDTASSKLTKFANKTQSDYGKASAALKSHNLGLKDTARIVQGIVISQAFYAGANAIASATSALWNFNKELDYANITYSALFGSTDLAKQFSTALQEHAVETIFDYQQLSNVSKKLLAYGIEYKNLMYVMEGMTNLGAMSGDTQAMDRIALALGQIKTTGYLTATEMRQLANAYVPIYDIVQNAFGLSGEQMQSIGDLKLPAHEVINAVVDYANERFGAVGDAATMTITGLENRIVDTLKVVGSAMIEPITTAYKSMLVYITSGLEEIRNAYNTGGLGGVFEFLVPDDGTQTTIRQFIANVRNLLMSLASVATVVARLFGNFAQVAVTAFNIVAPVVSNLVNVLSAVLNAMLQNSHVAAILRVALVAAAGAFVILRVQAAAALVITAVTKAITVLSGALVTLATVIVKHPIISLLLALGAALVGISTASNRADKSISGFFDNLSNVAGLSSKDVLQPVKNGLKDSANAADEFNKRLEEGAGAANDLNEAIGGTGKAAKKAKDAVGLLSFDEVFSLPEKTESAGGSGSGVGTGLVDALEGLGDVFSGLSESLIPEVPDFSDFIKEFTDGLFGGLGGSIVEKLESVGIGSLIGGTLGAIFGSILGGPQGIILGAKIGAFAGGVVGLLWEELEGALNNSFVGIGAGIANAIAKAFGISITGLGTLISKGTSLKNIFSGIATAIKTTGGKALLKGGLIGAAVGFFIDGLAHLLWSDLETKFEGANAETAKVGQTIGGIIGTIIGGLLGGPVGAVIGSAIGTFAGGFAGLFWEPIKNWFIETAASFAIWMNDVGTAYDEWRVNFENNINAAIDNTIASIGTWISDTWNSFISWVDGVGTAYDEWRVNFENTINTAIDNVLSAIGTWISDTWNSFINWVNGVGTAYDNWRVRFENAINTAIDNTLTSIGAWISNTWNGFINWATNVGKTIRDFFANTITGVSQWLSNMWNSMYNWFSNTKTSIVTWWNNLFDPSKWKSGWDAVKSWFSDLLSSVRNWFSNLKDSVGTWWDGLFSDKSVSVNTNASTTAGVRGTLSMRGHATGGVFDREHVARFAEGNRAEAVIPLENSRAMQPFVDAVSGGLVSSLAPIVASINAGNSNNLPPLYVGTLIADDRGIKQLYDKFEVIRLQESDRRGTTFA